REAAGTWLGDSTHVPFRTRRAGLALTELVGIVNVTPDSFSDGGLWLDPVRALEQAARLVDGGATGLDLGAESTRPGSRPIGADEEWTRLGAIVPALVGRWPEIRISVDTRHPETAERALAAGADWINDVGGLERQAMRDVVGRGV